MSLLQDPFLLLSRVFSVSALLMVSVRRTVLCLVGCSASSLDCAHPTDACGTHRPSLPLTVTAQSVSRLCHMAL